jgi:hypothetical protein
VFIEFVVIFVSQLYGIQYDCEALGDDLVTDYSLDIYNYHYHFDVMSPANSIDSIHMYGQQTNYAGFSLVAPDLYSRVKNPHMLLNEIGAIRFNETLYTTT